MTILNDLSDTQALDAQGRYDLAVRTRDLAEENHGQAYRDAEQLMLGADAALDAADRELTEAEQELAADILAANLPATAETGN